MGRVTYARAHAMLLKSFSQMSSLMPPSGKEAAEIEFRQGFPEMSDLSTEVPDAMSE
jgi:hypothetical protein